MSTDIKLSKAQASKIIQSGESFRLWLGNLRKKALANTAIPLARDKLPGLVSNLTSSAINKFDRKKGKRIFYSRKRTHIIYFKWRYEWYYKKSKIIRRFGCIHWWTLLARLAISLVQLVISSNMIGTSGRGVRRAGRGYINKNF